MTTSSSPASATAARPTGWLGAGLFLVTLASLLMETLDARLLSVLTWYHLSFFAVSLAMLGMAAGAVFVFLHPERFSPEEAPASLARLSLIFACAIPIAHIGNLVVPFLPLNEFSVMEIAAVTVSTAILAAPFILSGIVVTVALTRCGGAIGRLYACDLVGAAAGCLLVVPILNRTNISAAFLLAGAAAALGAFCFHRFAGIRGSMKSAVVAVALAAMALLNTGSLEGLQVIYPKNRAIWLLNSLNAKTAWNSHSYVLVQAPSVENAFLWGPGKGGDAFKTRVAWIAIDGEAGTPITEWDGRRESLEWVKYDVTTLPYYLRHGNVAVIGVGGGRDLLAALWGGNPSITGIDVNRIMLDNLTGSHRQFAGIADRPEVTLVHDDGRAYLTRAKGPFDVIQMSLVDTWASTGAGAFTLSENSLYTLDGWRVFLNKLSPGGVLSVSRWFDPRNVSETSRLLALGVAALIDRGVANPQQHVMLIGSGRVATLMVSSAPFTPEDEQRVAQIVAEREFQTLVTPSAGGVGGVRLNRIVRSRTMAELAQATDDTNFDYSPPTDRRPYFFNMLKPRAFAHAFEMPRGGALWGNLRATVTLLILLGVSAVLTAVIIIWPLARSGRPPLPSGRFWMVMAFFGVIGFAYMLIQIGLLQRFSVYLGHPTYTLAILLFSMLLFTGLGSLASDRVLALLKGKLVAIPVAIGVALAVTALTLPSVLAGTVVWGLPAKTLVVLAFTAPLSMLLGQCFPMGVGLLKQTPALVAWAWGVNGAAGVLASILAVCVSLWIEIDANFWAAAGLYLLLALPLAGLVRAAGPTK